MLFCVGPDGFWDWTRTAASSDGTIVSDTDALTSGDKLQHLRQLPTFDYLGDCGHSDDLVAEALREGRDRSGGTSLASHLASA